MRLDITCIDFFLIEVIDLRVAACWGFDLEALWSDSQPADLLSLALLSLLWFCITDRENIENNANHPEPVMKQLMN